MRRLKHTYAFTMHFAGLAPDEEIEVDEMITNIQEDPLVGLQVPFHKNLYQLDGKHFIVQYAFNDEVIIFEEIFRRHSLFSIFFK